MNILKFLIDADKKKHDTNVLITIRRNNVFEDGMYSFKKMSSIDLKAKVRVFYIDEFGLEERGIDG